MLHRGERRTVTTKQVRETEAEAVAFVVCVLAERFGHQLQYHGGGISGFQTVLQRYPEEGLVIAVMANVESDEDAPWTVGDGLAQISFSAERH
jgi:hypothetical protein